MSKRIEAKITCPNCSNQFDFTLYRSIWGEYPENRELVMTNQINVASCPSCNHATKLQYPFIYTNANQHFAVWWEPEYDAQIDSDSAGYAKMLGEGNYLATAPRIKSWSEFKNTILKFENGELKGKPGTIGKEMNDQMLWQICLTDFISL
jgi:Zn ribbon nucleic-acid-binding protein